MAVESRLQDLKEKHKQGADVRAPFERGWFLNLAYTQGHQWLYWASGRLHEPELEPWRVLFTDNRIIGIVRREIAKLTKSRPVWVCTPRSASEEHISGARLAEQAVDSHWVHQRLSRKHRAALRWSRVCSAGFWKVYWDKHKGDVVEYIAGPDGQPIEGPDGTHLRSDSEYGEQFRQTMGQVAPEYVEQLGVAKMAPGGACLEVKSPFQIVVDPLVEDSDLAPAEWIVEDSVRSVDYMKERYNEDLEPDAEAVSGLAESRMPALTRGQIGGGASTYKGVRVFELWERPMPSNEFKGAHVVWTDKMVLRDEPNPYGETLPYVMFSGIPIPGRFWPTNIVEQERSPQTELNKSRSQIRDNATRFGNPALLEARHAHVEYSGMPGEKVRFDATLPESVPAYLAPPSMPAYVLQEPDRMVEAMREIAAQHEVTQGTVPAGVTAASAINLLLEQGDEMLVPDVSDMEDSLSEAGCQLLRLLCRFATEEQILRIAGEDGAWDFVEFKGEMLYGHDAIEVQTGSAFPKSKAAKQAAMHELLSLAIQYGIPLKERDLRRFFKDYEVGGLERLFATLSQTEQQISRENRLLAQGEGLPVNSYDEHMSHIEGHEEEMRTARHARRPEQIQQLFAVHVILHRTELAKATPMLAPPPDGNGSGPGVQSDQQAGSNGSVGGRADNATSSQP